MIDGLVGHVHDHRRRVAARDRSIVRPDAQRIDHQGRARRTRPGPRRPTTEPPRSAARASARSRVRLTMRTWRAGAGQGRGRRPRRAAGAQHDHRRGRRASVAAPVPPGARSRPRPSVLSAPTRPSAEHQHIGRAAGRAPSSDASSARAKACSLNGAVTLSPRSRPARPAATRASNAAGVRRREGDIGGVQPGGRDPGVVDDRAERMGDRIADDAADRRRR